MDYKNLLQLYNEECAKTGKTPILKVNKQWLDEFNKLQFKYWTLNTNENNFLDDIGYEIDNSIKTFAFVYKDEE